MIERYSRQQMQAVWSDESKFDKMLALEVQVCRAKAKLGLIPAPNLSEIEERASYTMSRLKEIEKEVKHDVIAFLTNVAENVGDSSRFIHVGLTSSDVLDSALALQFKDALQLLEQGIDGLLQQMKTLAYQYKDLPQMGRTHGVHAEPISLGLKFALWYADMQRNKQRLQELRKRVLVGKLSGAVGTFAATQPEVEELALKALGLDYAKVSTQIVQRDRQAEYLNFCALVASCLEKIAVEIRNLQRTEIRELEEGFGKGQKGSSAMPHKKNPISCENITGLCRVMRGYALAGLENVALWHERDLSNSSCERITLADSSILLDYMLARMLKVLSNLTVLENNIQKNLHKTKGIIFSQKLMLALTKTGMLREDAYTLVQTLAHRAWDEDVDLKSLVEKESKIDLPQEKIEAIFSLQNFLINVDKIFARVFA